MHIRPKRSRLLLALLLLAACAGVPTPPAPVAYAAVAEGDKTVPSPAALSAAQVLLDKALAGFGGVQRVDRLRTLVVESTMTRNLAEGQQTEIRQRSYVEFPDRFRSEAILEDMTVASVVAPGGSFLLSPFGTLPIPEEERVEIERGLARSPLSLLKGRRHETFFVQAEGDGEIDGRAVDYLRVLFIGDSGTIARRATGPDTRLYAEIGSGEVPNGALITQIVFYVRDNHASDITASRPTPPTSTPRPRLSSDC